ncbi:MAG: hypothetical protein K2K57_01715 [Oscillospiraceae bacterium]|nr:hypothetical protein [Oscillospiraceae bacterium]
MLLIVIGAIFVGAVVFAFWESSRKPSEKQGFLLIIPLKKGMKDVEIRLREAANAACGGKLLLFDMGADEETLEICRRFFGERDNMGIIPDIISKESLTDPVVFRETILRHCRM